MKTIEEFLREHNYFQGMEEEKIRELFSDYCYAYANKLIKNLMR